MVTKYHLDNPEQLYLVSETDYNNILWLEKNYEQEADTNWNDFMSLIEKGELKEAISLREENNLFKIIRVSLRKCFIGNIKLHSDVVF